MALPMENRTVTRTAPEAVPTTGLLAAAAAKGAILALAGLRCETVEMRLPSGRPLPLPMRGSRRGVQWGEATVAQEAKESGPLKGIEIIVRVTAFDRPSGFESLFVEGGRGIGVAISPFLPVPVGSKAINPTPMKMIRRGVEEAIGASFGKGRHRDKTFLVSISIPGGEAVARRTLNPSWGVVGGLSILGTTGVVEPHGRGHQETIRAAILRAKKIGFKEVIFQRGAGSRPLRREGTILIGRHLAFSLQAASEAGMKAVLCEELNQQPSRRLHIEYVERKGVKSGR
jgi:cobalt-precorrin-5B (C1)-methyltransferase